MINFLNLKDLLNDDLALIQHFGTIQVLVQLYDETKHLKNKTRSQTGHASLINKQPAFKKSIL